MGSKIAPFRWNVGNPELWKRLGAGPAVRPPAGFHDALLRLVADVVRLWGDRADLVFVGRSLESAFDLLSGALAETDYRDRVQLLQLSLRYDTPGQLRRTRPGELAQLWSYFDELRLTPPRLLERERPVAFVDLVHSGGTFGNLVKLLRHWSGGPLERWRPVRARLRWGCVVERGHPRYDAWGPEWSRWPREFPAAHVKRVFLDSRLWRYLGEDQPKTTPSFTPRVWGERWTRRPPELRERIRAAHLARALFRTGRRWRRHLADELVRRPRPTGDVLPIAAALRDGLSRRRRRRR